MKHLFLVATIICFLTLTTYAQHDHSSRQQPSTTDTSSRKVSGDNNQKEVPNIFSIYTNIKNALVAGDVASAASNADQFLKLVNTIDYKLISEGNIHILAKDAGNISSARDLAKQRQYFASLSSNMVAVAKTFKVSATPIYVQYCPMKKASWLSSEKEIRNPYYGSAMLTCGEIIDSY